MDPGELVPRLIVAFMATGFMLALSFGWMRMQQQAIEGASERGNEIIAPPSQLRVITGPTRDPQEERRKEIARAIEAWQKKRDTSEAGLEPLVAAAALDPRGVDPGLQRVLHEEVPADRCRATGLRLAKQRPDAAMAFLHAAQRRANGREEQARIASALDELSLAAALAESRAARESKDFPLADNRLREAAELVTKLWVARLAVDADPWKNVPAAVREDLEDDNPGATPEQLVQALERHVRDRKWLPPETEKLKAELPRLLAGWGVRELEQNRESGLERLRGALRSGDAAAKKTAVEGLQAACRDALARQDFAALVDLAGFIIAETSMDAGDPFRGELKKGLEGAGEHFGEKSPRTRVFVLTLLADLLGADPAGAAVRAEALAMGEQLMGGLTAKPADPELLRVPSGLPGYSAMRVENGTTFHLMLFFAGPEKFYVRLNPMRRGLVVLKDGAYATAVMGNTEDVVPYRGTRTFASDVKDARYTVKREGRGASSWYGDYAAAAYGPYSLLRVADGADARTVTARFVETPPEEPDDARAKAIAALRTGTGIVAGDAIRELAKHKASAEAFEALARALESHPEPGIRNLAAESLPRFRRRFDVLKDFEKSISRAAPDEVAGLAGFAVRGRIAGVERLIAAGLANPAARRGLIRLLAGAEIPLSEAEKLLAPLTSDPDPDTRKQARRALAERASAKGFAAAEALLASTDLKERRDGVFLLNYYKESPRTEWLLLQLVERETDRGLKGDLLRTICSRGGTAYPTLLAKALRTGTKADKLDALHYLYVWPGKVDPLRASLQAAAADPDPQVRQRAAQKLAELQAR